MFVLIAEVLATGYLALIAWIMSTWMVDGSQAIRMRDIDWLFVAGLRCALWLAVAGAFVFVARKAHRRWVLSSHTSAWFRGIPLLLGGGIAVSGAIGAAWFVLERPFM